VIIRDAEKMERIKVMIASLPMNVCIACHAIPKKEGIQDPQHTAVYSQKVGVCYIAGRLNPQMLFYIFQIDMYLAPHISLSRLATIWG
jgi:hypothetical protein